MEVRDAIKSLRESADFIPRSEYPWEERPSFSAPSQPIDIEAFELASGFELPSDVREFFREVDQIIGMSIHNGYWIGGISNLISMAHEDQTPTAIDGQSVMPIATDGGGNVFFLSSTGQVFRMCHETKETSRCQVTFSEFLERVAKDWKAFVSDEPGWSYLV